MLPPICDHAEAASACRASVLRTIDPWSPTATHKSVDGHAAALSRSKLDGCSTAHVLPVLEP
jgi:hypothetical protein